MSFLMAARMGQFPCDLLQLVDSPGKPFDAVNVLGAEYKAPALLATINWLTDPVLGIPRQPFDIELCEERLSTKGDSWSNDGVITLDEGHNFSFAFVQAIGILGVDDLFCVTCRCISDDAATEIFALDGQSREIPETRQSANAPLGTALIGPGVFGVRATGKVRLESVVAFGVHNEAARPFRLLAKVAPACSGIAAYDQQQYLGRDQDAGVALATRLTADALARANGQPPGDAELERLVHREATAARAAQLLKLEPVDELERNFATILDDPKWTFISKDAKDVELEICPATSIQHLSLAGPVEATTLGYSVTLPIQAPFPLIASLKQIYDEVMASGTLPIPVVRVTGYYRQDQNDVTARQFAALTFVHEPAFSAQGSGARLPDARDAPGTADVVFIFSRRDRALSFYPDLSAGSGKFPYDQDRRPLPFLAGGDSADETATGLPRIVAGPVEIPLDAPSDQPLVVHARDVFGRWAQPVQGACPLLPLPVQKPGLFQPEISYRDDDTLGLRFRLSWDWTLRTPFDIRIALASSVGGQDVKPSSGLALPELAPGARLSIRFKGDLPEIDGQGLPGDATVAVIPLTLEQGQIAAPDQRQYMVSMSMGSAAAHFEHDNPLWLVVAADAWEVVSGRTDDRRSAAAHDRSEYFDPRAPIVQGPEWALVWTSRPDGGNVGRAWFDLASLSQGPVAGYYAWRVHESALLHLAAEEITSDVAAREHFIAGILATRDKRVRLAMIRNAVVAHLHKPAFRKAFIALFEVDRTTLAPHDIELEFAGAQVGLEFVMFSAMSTVGVASDKLQLSNLFAVGVPPRPVAERPSLRLFTPDAGSPLATSNSVVAVVSATNAFDENELTFHWDDVGVASSDELLHTLDPIARIDAMEADRLVPGVMAALSGNVHANQMIFVLQPPMRWVTQHFACSISRAIAGGAFHDVSARSTLAAARLVPPMGPQLTIKDVRRTPDDVVWTVTAMNVGPQVHETLMPCRIQVDLIDRGTDRPTASPQTFADFVRDGAKVGPVSATSTVSGDVEVRHLADLVDKTVWLAVSDPAGRIDNVILEPRDAG